MPEYQDAGEFFAAERLKWPEKTFQAEVLKRARELGWTHAYHTFFSNRSETGFPDLMLVRPSTSQIVFAELKSMRGRLGPKQQDWLDALRTAQGDGTVRVFEWRPCCWNTGEIERALL